MGKVKVSGKQCNTKRVDECGVGQYYKVERERDEWERSQSDRKREAEIKWASEKENTKSIKKLLIYIRNTSHEWKINCMTRVIMRFPTHFVCVFSVLLQLKLSLFLFCFPFMSPFLYPCSNSAVNRKTLRNNIFNVFLSIYFSRINLFEFGEQIDSTYILQQRNPLTSTHSVKFDASRKYQANCQNIRNRSTSNYFNKNSIVLILPSLFS